jgi:hypothetical protein
MTLALANAERIKTEKTANAALFIGKPPWTEVLRADLWSTTSLATSSEIAITKRSSRAQKWGIFPFREILGIYSRY